MKKLTPPTPQQVAEYSKAQGCPLDGEHFCAYYGMAGWTLKNGRPMKDWQSAVRYWIALRKQKEQPKTDASKAGQIMKAIDAKRASER